MLTTEDRRKRFLGFYPKFRQFLGCHWRALDGRSMGRLAITINFAGRCVLRAYTPQQDQIGLHFAEERIFDEKNNGFEPKSHPTAT